MKAISHCGGCPFPELLDTTLDEWRDGCMRVGLVLQPFHFNRSGVVRGGVPGSLLDHAGGFSGLFPMTRKKPR